MFVSYRIRMKNFVTYAQRDRIYKLVLDFQFSTPHRVPKGQGSDIQTDIVKCQRLLRVHRGPVYTSTPRVFWVI